MKKHLILVITILLTMTTGLLFAGDLDSFINNLNIEAKTDLSEFKATVSAEFSTSGVKVNAMLKAVDTPADAYLCFKVAKITSKSPQEVLKVYKANKNKGWGYIAKKLGIKPGSAEFHALKKRNIDNSKKGKGNNKGKGGKGRKK